MCVRRSLFAKLTEKMATKLLYKSGTPLSSSRIFLRIEKKWKGRRFSKDFLKAALPASKRMAPAEKSCLCGATVPPPTAAATAREGLTRAELSHAQDVSQRITSTTSSRATSGHWELAPGKMAVQHWLPQKGSQRAESRAHLSPKNGKHRGSQDKVPEKHRPPSAHRGPGTTPPCHPAPCPLQGPQGLARSGGAGSEAIRIPLPDHKACPREKEI